MSIKNSKPLILAYTISMCLNPDSYNSCVWYCIQRRPAEDAAIRELAPEFRPPEWLTDVVARTTPYLPQMGDEVIYFVQGHQQYVDAVKSNNVYRIDVDRNQPWHKMPHIRVCLRFFCLSVPRFSFNTIARSLQLYHSIMP